MPWRPSEPGEVPTLGWLVIDWIRAYLSAPDRVDYAPFLPYREQEDFILRFYELDPRTGRRRYRRAVLSRPRGFGKSPLLAAISCAEALGPVVPDGWDADGQPVGREWLTVRTPLVQVAAVSEQQTKNTWSPLLEMLDSPALFDDYPGLEPMETFVNLPRGRIEPVTSSARTIKGNRPVFCVLDQTEEWVPSNGGPKLAETIRINAAKVGGSTIESPNAFTPGDDSVAEASAQFWQKIREGSARDRGLYYDHREAPPETDLSDRESLIAGLRVAYGDSSGHAGGCVIHGDDPCPPGHVDLDVIAATCWDPSISEQKARADFLNQITHASDSWVSQPEWAACLDLHRIVADGDPVVLGFDGSRARRHAVTDATALIGCRVSDGHVFTIGVWEQPEGPAGQDWQVPAVEVDAAVRHAFETYTVVGFYADPALWESYIAGWEADYGSRLRVRSSRDHPIERWMTDRKGTAAVEALHTAIVDGQMSHDGDYALTRHVLNARRKATRWGMSIRKEHPSSSRKIDAAVAAALAWECRLQALATGAAEVEQPRSRRLVRW